MNTTQLRDASEISLVAYGQFIYRGEPPRLEDLTSLNGDTAGFSGKQAQRFAGRFLVALPTFNDATSFDATVFVGRDATAGTGNSKEIYIAMRGTQQRSGSPNDLTASSAILSDGAAFEQIVAMHNWYRRISAPAGQSVAQFGITTLATFATVPPGHVLVSAGAQSGQYVYRLPDIAATGELTDLLAEDPDHKVTIAGSSLGGHLAMAFAALFPEQTSQGYAFNSPGFKESWAVNGFFNKLGGGRPISGNSLITNVVSSEANNAADRLDLIAGHWGYPGQQVVVPIENQFNSDVIDPKKPSWNHDQRQVTDALALYQLLQSLDPTHTLASQNTLTRLAAAGDTRSLENLVDALEQWFGMGSAPLQAGNSEASRNALHAAMQALEANASYNAVAGHLRVKAVGADIGNQSHLRSDFQNFVALQTLSPFVLEPASSMGQSALDALWQSPHWNATYQAWLSDKVSINAGGRAEAYSEQYLSDRAALLAAVLVRNQSDNQGVLTSSNAGPAYAKGVLYEDLNSATTIRTGTVTDADRLRIWFGSAAAESKSGTALADHLYGGAGSDSLSGQAGNDYLEGGAGNDAIDGGGGNDTLLGGKDTDAYTFGANWGHDVIDDSDGAGSIAVTGLGAVNGEGALKVANNVWQTADKRVNYTLVSVDAARNDLYVTFSDRPDVITVRNWSESKKLGVTLGQTPAPASPVNNTYVGDFAKKLTGTTYAYVGGNYVNNGQQANAADIITGSASADKMSGLGGNDALAGLAGDDYIEGGTGNDLLLGGAGRDSIEGGDGTDFIFGAGVGSLTYPLSTLTQPHPAEGPEIARGFDWVAFHGGTDAYGIRLVRLKGADASWVSDDVGNLIDGGAGNDWIEGGPGKDTIRGGSEDDDIEGLGQADILFGDGGNDTISGDGIALNGYSATVAGNQHGDDIIDGGAGQDSLTGQGGSDQLYGGIGNDSLWGDDIDERFTPFANHGADYLHGGDGADEATGGGGDDTLIGGEGNDQLIADWSPTKLPGEHHGSDFLDGGTGADYLEGGGRDDMLLGGAGNDMLWGDAAATGLTASDTGADYLDGGEGDDALVGGGKSDTLYGGGGNDSIVGDGPNTPADDQGDDLLDGGQGSDTLQGGGGFDSLSGGADGDLLQGGDGNDTLVGGAGTDVLQGGSGDDTYLIAAGDSPLDGAGAAEVIDDQQGVNTVRFQGLSPEAMTIAAMANGYLQLQTSAGGALLVANGVAASVDRYEFDGAVSYRSDQLIGRYSATAVVATRPDGRQHAVGGRNNDNLSVASAGATLSGGRGNDTLRGSGGNNTYLFEVGDGADTITDTSAKTSATGAPTPNRLVFGVGITAADLKLTNSGGAGGFRIQVGAEASQGITLGSFNAGLAAAPIPIDSLVFADGTSLSYAQLVALGFDGTMGDEFISGTALNDRLDGGLGNDTLSGGLGSDTYRWSAGAGNDQIMDGDTAASASDVLHIGAGATAAALVYVRSGNDLTVRARDTDSQVTVVGHYTGSGIERLTFDDGSALTQSEIDARLTNELTESRDVFTGTAGNDFIGSRGGDDVVYGIGGNDLIDGGTGNDQLYGGHGNDSLYGNQGTDVLYGEIGNDLVDGGEGNDQLTGADGDDTLVGGGGSDYLSGDGGQDRLVDGEMLYGGNGSDTYAFTGWQAATIYEGIWASPDVDVLSLPVPSGSTVSVGLGYNSISYAYDDLTLSFNGSTITVSEYFGAPAGNNTIETIRFSDGISWTAADILARAPANATTEGDDALVRGFRWNDVIDGKGGNDYLKGATGDDRLLGGAGNDTVNGESGADTVEGGSGNDQLNGDGSEPLATDGNDRIDGGAGDDILYGAGGNDMLLGDTGKDTLTGGAGLDTLSGGTGADLLAGGEGDDTYLVSLDSGYDDVSESAGTDRLSLGTGIVASDVGLFRDGLHLVVTVKQTVAQTRVMHHFSSSASALDRIDFADGTVWNAATILSRTIGGSANAMTGTPVNDSHVVDNADDSIAEPAGGGIDTALSSVSYTLPANVENLTLTGHVNLSATGNELDNVLLGNAGSNRLDGRAGADTLQGGLGDDYYMVSPGDGDVVLETSGGGTDTVNSEWDYTLPTHVENLIGGRLNRRTLLIGNELNNEITMTNSQWAATIKGGTGADTMTALAPHSTFYVDNAADVVVGSQGNIATTRDWTLAEGWHDLALLAGAQYGTGNAGANRLFGNGQNDTLVGLAGNDTFYGGTWSAGSDVGLGGFSGTGVDHFIGGQGNDLYHVEWNATVRDTFVELANEGEDTVDITGIERVYAITDFAHVENMSLADTSGAAGLTGDDAANRLTGNSSNNLLDGGGGNDTLSDYWQRGYGFSDGLQDTLLGGSGDDVLVSWGGSDILDGGSGNDIYSIQQDSSARVAFGAGSGSDTVLSSETNAALGPLVVLTPGTRPSDLLLARDGKNLKMGVGTPADSLTWVDFFADPTSSQMTGNFGYLELAETAQLTAVQVLSRLQSGNTNLATAGDDGLLGGTGNDTLNALAGSDVLMGDAGDDELIGGAGDDDLRGGAGNDTYRLNIGDGADRIMDSSGSSDTLVFGTGIAPADVNVVGYDGGGMMLSLANGADYVYVSGGSLESVRFANGTVWNAAYLAELGRTRTGSANNDYLFGDESDNIIRALAGNDTVHGGAGNDQIDGGTGNDSMLGQAGDDAYTVDSTGDRVVENPGEGVDSVTASVSFTLGADVENLSLSGTSGLSGTGNAHNNLLVGNAGNNTLSGNAGNDTVDGGAGVDTLIGGTGDDGYVVDASGDVVTEAAGAGVDTVQASASWSMSANVEHLVLTGSSAINGTGNASANTITGNAGNNRLDGGAGNDTLTGGAGDDSYLVDSTADSVVELDGQGTDLVTSTATYTLSGNIENLSLTGSAMINGTGNTLNNLLTGNASNNTLTGGAGNDTLDGGAGTDRMIGGTGDDRYVVNVASDVITELANEGIDGVSSSASYTLAAHVENLALTGTSAISGTGNALDNLLIGNSAANTLTGGDGNDSLDGGAGNDTMVGGAGNDSYTVDASGDRVTEDANRGIDVVQASTTHTLGNNVENLVLIGSNPISGTGNALNNVITGNAAVNSLNGGAGSDTLDGAAGNDSLVGGTGADVYRFGSGYGIDTVSENDATAGTLDAVQLLGGITQASVRFGRSGNSLELLLAGSTDKMVFQNWYLGNQYHVEQFRFSDGAVLSDVQAQALVGAMAGFSAGTSSGLGNTASQRMTIPPIELAASTMV